MNDHGIFILTVGLPRSGKSTWAKTQNNSVVISNDWIRENILGVTHSRATNPAIWMITDATIRILLSQGKTVILDGINHTKVVRKEFLNTAKEMNASTEIAFVNTPVSICIERNETQHKLPNNKIQQFYNELEEPTSDEADRIIYIRNWSN